MRYTTIIFDLDGTLLDTLDDLTSAVNHALSVYGLPERNRDEVRAFIGNGQKKLLERASGGQVPTDELLPLFREYYIRHSADKTKPYDGILALLQALKTQGVKTAVVSNKPHYATKPLVENYFSDLIFLAQGEDEANGIMRKPNPASLLAVMEKLQAQKDKTVYIGDSEVDIETAQNAEIDCISVSWGFKDEEFLKQNGATALAKTVDELRRLLEKE